MPAKSYPRWVIRNYFGLRQEAQQDWSAGMAPSLARELIPGNGVYGARNALYDAVDGSVFRRGGTAHKSNAAFGTGLRTLVDAQLAAGQRTVTASGANFGVLDVDDATVVNLGNGGLSTVRGAVEIGGAIFFGGGKAYAGSRKTANYSTGTVAVTNGSPTVTGTGTTWNTLVDAGMFFQRGSERQYVVKSVDSTTQITLAENYAGVTGSGAAYTLAPMVSATRTSNTYVAAGNRLLSLEGSNVYFSNYGDPWTFPATNFHPLTGQIIGGIGLLDRALIFTTAGLWVLSNLTAELVDSVGNVQQRKELVSKDLILWSHEGLTTWQQMVVAPCSENLWLLDGISQPRRIQSSDAIKARYAGLVRAGYKTGVATVSNSHLLLPVLDSSNGFIDFLVCRLDMQSAPFSYFDGYGAQLTALAQRIGTGARQPILLGAGSTSASRIQQLSYFDPGASVKNDADGSTFTWDIDTRDYATGSGKNVVRRVRARYVLTDAASDAPLIGLYASKGLSLVQGTQWGAFNWGGANWTDSSLSEFVQVSGGAPVSQGRDPYSWGAVNMDARYVHFKLRCVSPAASLVLKSFELDISPSGRQ